MKGDGPARSLLAAASRPGPGKGCHCAAGSHSAACPSDRKCSGYRSPYRDRSPSPAPAGGYGAPGWPSPSVQIKIIKLNRELVYDPASYLPTVGHPRDHYACAYCSHWHAQGWTSLPWRRCWVIGVDGWGTSHSSR